MSNDVSTTLTKAANIARDRFVNRELRKASWRVIRIWEHQLTKSRERCVEQIRRAVTNI